MIGMKRAAWVLSGFLVASVALLAAAAPGTAEGEAWSLPDPKDDTYVADKATTIAAPQTAANAHADLTGIRLIEESETDLRFGLSFVDLNWGDPLLFGGLFSTELTL